MNLLSRWRLKWLGRIGASCGFVLALTLSQATPVNSEDHTENSKESGTGVLVLWQDGDSGERLNLRGRVISAQGRPIPGALVEVRQANGDAEYTPAYQGSITTTDRGTFSLQTVVPGQYTSAKHIHVRVTHPTYQTRGTEILFKGDPNISFGQPGAIEVLLERIHQNDEVVSVGGVEIVLNSK